MTGHAPKAAVAAISAQLDRGITTMLPTEDSLWVAAELSRRFGLRYWQLALTATDANRFAVRLARHVTHRPKILVYNYCYHGSVDETIITINDGVPGPKPGNAGPPVDPTVTTKVIEWNDVAGARGGAGARRCGLRAGRAGADEHRHHPAGTRLPRRPAPAHARHRHAAGHRRDAHHQRGSGRVHAGLGPGAGHGDARQAHRQRHPKRRLRLRPVRGRPRPRRLGLPRRRRVRRRRYAGRQRAVRGGHARHARRGAQRRGVRSHHPAGRALGGGRTGRDRRVRPAVGGEAPRLPRRVLATAGGAARTAARRPPRKTRSWTATCTSSC